jgi:hypothetical protein
MMQHSARMEGREYRNRGTDALGPININMFDSGGG